MIAVCAATLYFGVLFSKPIVRATPTPAAMRTFTQVPAPVIPMPSISVRTGPITPLPDISGVMREETTAPGTATPGLQPPSTPVPPVPPKPPH